MNKYMHQTMSLRLLAGVGMVVLAGYGQAASQPSGQQPSAKAHAPAASHASKKSITAKKSAQRVVAAKTAPKAAPTPQIAAASTSLEPNPVPTQVLVVSQPVAPAPWLKPFEFHGVSSNPYAPSPAYTAGYEPRPNPYANAYVPQPVQPIALQAPNFNMAAMAPFSYSSTAQFGDFLPKIKKVQPTGERPMLVVSLKCPTEALGVATPSTKILHGAVDMALTGVNATNVLPWSIQQVCS